MSPQADELARRLAELQAELEHVQRNIDSVLERSDESGQRSLRERLETAIQHFETSHPVLTATMGSVMDQLANLGI